MSTVIYTERGRRELGTHFCELVELGESNRGAAVISGLSRRTFARWCRESPALASRYARAVQARAALYKRRRSHLRRLLAAERRGLRGTPAKSTEGKAARARVEKAKKELADFATAVRCVRMDTPRRLRDAGKRAAH